MKRLLAMLLVLALLPISCFAAEALTADDFVLVIDGESFDLGDAAADLVVASEAAFGAMTKTEADSCMFQGKDREWSNDALAIGSYPIGTGNSDVTESVIVYTDQLMTARGACVGMDKETIRTLYGDDYFEDWDQWIYQMGEDGPMLIFSFDLDTDVLLSWMLLKNTAA